MRLEQISEKIRDHLTNQKEQSRNGGSCAYRSHTGARCAVGCLVNDDFYSWVLEGLSVRRPAVLNAVCASLGIEYVTAAPQDKRLLMDMLIQWQKYHDHPDAGMYAQWCKDGSGMSPQRFHEEMSPFWSTQQ